jgi:hypothetical protein
MLTACGDGSSSLSNLSWQTWAPLQATGTGTFALNDCTPDCAEGTFHDYLAIVTLSKPVSTPYGFLFSQIFVQPAAGGFEAFSNSLGT